MTDEELENHPGWKWCTFEGAREQTLRVGLETSFREKLEWLEYAESLSMTLQHARIRYRDPENPDSWIVMERSDTTIKDFTPPAKE